MIFVIVLHCIECCIVQNKESIWNASFVEIRKVHFSLSRISEHQAPYFDGAKLLIAVVCVILNH